MISLVATTAVAGLLGYATTSPAPVPVAVSVAGVAGLWMGLVGACVWASRRHGTGRLSSDLGLRLGGWRDLLGGLALGVACQEVLIRGIYLPFESIDPHLSHQLAAPAHHVTGAAQGILAVFVLGAALSVGAPLVEELFFRGLVLRGLAAHLPTPLAVVVSAAIFGAAHLEGLQFPGLMAFGIVLAVLAWRTGRLGAGIAAHAAFNLTALAGVVHLR